ncbi:MAG: hypothetical protein UX88_C0014G0009 [Candidatus Woesebacteria bacterium GW2011_GWC2_47_16]|uniref:SCP domain-containing protein n=4 Tax=Candidatus Woeseibacteriota TaxID=1752722 RepID=A0A1F8D639_9BACT|nr:MAG: hypothetical protein UX88_C0014G0009 [Candidatus Woesebacteria bacterium GW2011_GWC2_47_16]OGM83428.1 MAG: hypothetical protein A2376_02590 [Candidatus Woesebacteria bacterium RIFOXYB1_FULL_47_31]
MKLFYKLAHLFFPRESNNHKAKILHLSGLTIVTSLLIFYQVILTFLPQLGPRILGYAANISADEVIRLTNEKRVAVGLAPLQLNSTLSQAAQAKGVDMLNKDYWAHVAPDGTQPWKFFIDFGYKYRYAGENLARDFSNAASAVDAWMASPSHKENMLSPKYREIGIGVVEGDLAGVDTTIVVQFFGATYADTVPAPVAKVTPSPKPVVLATPQPTAAPLAVALFSPTPTPISRVLISPFSSTKGISLATVGLLLGVLVIDGVVTSRRRIVRIGGRTFAHLAFLGMILAIALILKAGQII